MISDEPEVQTTTLSVAGMSCDACVRHVTSRVDALTGVLHVGVALETGTATIEHLPAYVDVTALVAAIREARYAARVEGVVPDSQEAPAPQRVSACACGCCAPRPKTAEWSNLGPSTIG